MPTLFGNFIASAQPYLFVYIFLMGLIFPDNGFAAHGVSLDGGLKYPADFKKFSYVSSNAKPGGQLTLHALGSFDKLNPFTLKGEAPRGIGQYVFETLTTRCLDEPFAQYGLIARDIDVAADGKSVTYTLDERARFSDGTPVTAEDVLFSLQTLKGEAAHPFYRMYFHDIESADILSPQVIRFNFVKVNRELHMISGELPILSEAFFTRHPFTEKGQMAVPIGSGPYIISKVNLGKAIEYTKNPGYWAKDLPARRGMFNFDTIDVKYFMDPTVSLEAFKAGVFDLMYVNIAKQWARDMNGRRFDNGELVKKSFPHKNCAGMQGFVFNLRKPLFFSRKVRQALGLAFDFEWTNHALFYNQYIRTNSFFANSDCAAQGLPEGKELALLEPSREQLPKEIFIQPLAPPSTKASGSLRDNLRKAKKLLAEEGWQVKNNVLVNGDGEVFSFEIILVSQTFERVMAGFVKNLQRLGVKASYTTLDQALYNDKIKNFDFDMTVGVFAQSQSPGNEQRNFWSSASAAQKGSRNIIGLADPVVDKLVDAIVYAKTRQELTAACRALDRVLWYGYYVIPNWYLASHRYVFNSHLQQPETLPLYYGYQEFPDLWWYEP